MADHVERKKSYRWVSASQASYDGSGWDSSDENTSDEGNDRRETMVSRKGTIAKLPNLPKLAYMDTDARDTLKDGNDGIVGADEAVEPKSEIVSQELKSPQLPLQQQVPFEESSGSLETPRLRKTSSNTSSKGSMQTRRTPVNEGLENLMVQISKEMSPDINHSKVLGKFESVDQELDKADYENDDEIPMIKGVESGSKEDQTQDKQDDKDSNTRIFVKNETGEKELSDSEANGDEADSDVVSGYEVSDDAQYEVSKSGYFSNLIEPDDGNDEEKDYVVSGNTSDHMTRDSESEEQDASPSEDDSDEYKKNNQEDNSYDNTNIQDKRIVDEPYTRTSVEPEESFCTPPLSAPHITQGSNDINDAENDGEEKPVIEIQQKTASDDERKYSPSINDSFSQTRQSSYDDYSSDDGGDDLSYTDSIKYRAVKSESEHELRSDAGHRNHNNSWRSETSDKESQIEDHEEGHEEGSDEDAMKVSKSGYFNKMISDEEEEEEDDDSHGKNGDDNEKNGDVDTLSSSAMEQASPDNTNSRNEKHFRANSATQSDVQEITEKVTTENDVIANNITENDVAEKGISEKDIIEKSVSEKSITERDIVKKDTDKEIIEKDYDTGEETSPINTRQSVNLGKWRPNTEAFRNGFLEDSSNRAAPPGYVYDENGKLIDLTPSSMKPRIPSAYSEVESSWDAFPSEDTEADMETIRDTRTIYDNHTVFNVPGLIANNQSAPPLPEYAAEMSHNDSSDDPKSLGTSLTTSSLEGDSGPPQTHFKEVFSLQVPDSKEIAKISQKNKVPSMDINKMLNSNISHEQKIQQLRDHWKESQHYDTGIQTWLSYSLKSSSKSDKDYLFEEYKVSNHVRDAYAHADELNRKHSVINTVASVNQNMTHLTKKVILQSRKSRGLFSSIGKKKL
ncbi:hypothetical protein HG535_0B00460 [Zygotorulaspora mrakii]|uniref:Protein FYV8 n=1 Tax=Zygotorulaspora mrakii TaxID=42260 RepID=A0A7H9AX67_ZYGMR|nr:uncharacterized protein HG535_0B00460 [Zygotorulaspora mrakii]QLG71008.1 hypothetical protein HG535_0B00460 [Zygotorulaspora mrakii]